MRWARWAGAGYLVIIVAGIFGEFFVRGSLVVAGDAAATAANVQGAESLFRAGVAGEFLMLLADVLVAAALYVVFRGANRNLALLAAFLRLAHASVVGVNLVVAYSPLLVLGGAPYMAAFDPAQQGALTLLLFELHAYGYAAGLVFFGAHCLVLGALIVKSGYVPRVLGVLLVVAGLGYLVDSLARTLLVDYAAVEGVLTAVVFIPAFVGEFSFCVWLLVRGADPRRGAAAA